MSSTAEEGGTSIGALAVDGASDVAAFDVWRYLPASSGVRFHAIVIGSPSGARRHTRRQLAGTVIGLDRTRLLIRREGGELVSISTKREVPRVFGRFRGPVALASGSVAALRKGVLHVLDLRSGKTIERARLAGVNQARLIGFDGRLLLYSWRTGVRLRDVHSKKDVPVRLPDGVSTTADLTSAGLFFVVDSDRVAFVPRHRLTAALTGAAHYPPPAVADASSAANSP